MHFYAYATVWAALALYRLRQYLIHRRLVARVQFMREGC